MKHIFSVATVLGAALAQTSVHDGHSDFIDTTDSTKEIGLLLWQYFFQEYVEGQHTEASSVIPAKFKQDIHVCWF